jgi:hypothetical protein
MGDIVRDLIEELEAALTKAGDSPTDRLAALVHAEVLFHSKRQAEAFVGRSELRSLEGVDREEVVALYDHVTSMFDATIGSGIKRGEFKALIGPRPRRPSLRCATACRDGTAPTASLALR